MEIHLMLLIGALCVTTSFSVPTGTSLVQSDETQCSGHPLAASANEFAFRLTKELSNNVNTFVSPFSVYTALALLYMGSRNQTAEELESVFQWQSEDRGSFHKNLSDLLKVLRSRNDEYSLSLANGLFVQQNYDVNPDYIKNATKCYDALVRTLDFAQNGQQAMQEINTWVAENTGNKIQDFLKEPLNANTALAIMNAIYFKGTWKLEFNKDATYNGPFIKANGETKLVDYMFHRERSFRYFEDAESKYKFLELPYKGEDVVMLWGLPISYDDQTNLDMTPELLCRVNRSMVNTKLQSVAVPKFKLDYSASLRDVLIKMGIRQAFGSDADLTGISSNRDLAVSNVQHQAIIEVNEEGSEAAGATGVFLIKLSLNLDPDFVANRPFVFYIIDKRSGVILFSGRVVDP